MALLSSSCVFSAPYSSSTMVMPVAGAAPVFMKPFALHVKCCPRVGVITNKRGSMIVKASSETGNLDGGESRSESDDEEDLPLNELPLDSKLQLKLEKKMRMKLSKKIRLRRKKLVRKRMMRKKGRWPPSKMKKLKNV